MYNFVKAALGTCVQIKILTARKQTLLRTTQLDGVRKNCL